MRSELDTRHLPYEPVEVSYATNRPAGERTPIPVVGQQVLYRREFWDQEPVQVTVVSVQDLGDRSDPNLWRLVRDVHGNPMPGPDGDVLMVPVPDPWPLLWLRGWWPPYPGGKPEEREAQTREARLRGSPGWLPLDWRLRPVRTPQEFALVARPPLTPPSLASAAPAPAPAPGSEGGTGGDRTF